MTRMSGAAAMTASAVSRMRRRIAGNCLTTAAKPMMDSSSIAKREANPSIAMARPSVYDGGGLGSSLPTFPFQASVAMSSRWPGLRLSQSL